jgi:hypothetical protein
MKKKVIVCKEGAEFRRSGPNAAGAGEYFTRPHQGARWEEVSPGTYAWVLEAEESFPCEDWGYEYPVLYIRRDDRNTEKEMLGI